MYKIKNRWGMDSVPPISVLIKPASSKCNLKCQYCFYHDVSNSRSVADLGFMSPETLEKIIRKVLQFASGYATFSFQGGEPTLCGIDFFEAVVKLLNQHNVNNVKINRCIQTNGLLIDGKWAEFLHDQNFLVGLSLDGPQRFHDQHRVDAGGKGTWERVMQTSLLLDEYKVDYNILFVVNKLTARHPQELYNFFKRHNFNFLQFMPCIDPENNQRGLYPYSLEPQYYTFFLKHFFDKWCTDFMGGREVSIRYFDNLVRMAAGLPHEMCSLLGSCQCQFVFEADGSVYPCDFYVTDEWKLGNIAENELPGLYHSDNSRRFRQSSLSTASICQDCKWKFLCRGGCRRDRENPLTGGLERNYYCESYAEFLPYAYPRLMEVARYVQKVQSRRREAQLNTQQKTHKER
jgi:uncharacterized protein